MKRKPTLSTAQKRAKTSKRPKAKGAGGDAPAWEDIDKKRDAYLAVAKEIVANSELGKKYLESDEEARKAFASHGCPVPEGVKVVFLRAGDAKPETLGAGSAVIELPQAGTDPSEDELLENFLCTYTINW